MATSENSYDVQVKELQQRCLDYLSQIAQRDHKISVLNAHINNLDHQLMQRGTIRSLIRQLLTEIDNKIIRTLTRRGQRKETIRVNFTHIPKLVGDEGVADLLKIAHDYDVKEFFALHPKNKAKTLKPQYRIAAKAYRLIRDGMKKAFIKTRRLLRGAT